MDIDSLDTGYAFDAFVYLPGNDYKESTCRAFLNHLKAAFGKPVIFVQLMENKSKSIGYESLEPLAYSKYIARSIGRPGKYVMMGISMGCLHIANFAHYYPSWCYKVMFMLEPTICQGIYPLLHDFEDGRGNGEWLADLKARPNNLDIPANEKVMDIAIDKTNPIPSSIAVGLVYTTRSNENKPYTAEQVAAKNKYYHWLSKTHKTYMLHLNSDHCVDTHSHLFGPLINFISKVLRVNG